MKVNKSRYLKFKDSNLNEGEKSKEYLEEEKRDCMNEREVI